MCIRKNSEPLKPILVLNGAEDHLQLVLGREEEILFSQESKSPARSVQALPFSLQACLQATNMKTSDIGGIVCVRGPGGFTGIRVVLSMALGLAKGQKLPMAGLDYLPLLACRPCLFCSGELWILTYARMNMVYAQGFICPEAQPVDAPGAFDLQNMQKILRGREAELNLVGTGVHRNLEFWQKNLPNAAILSKLWNYPSADVLLQKAWGADFGYEQIQPMYLRTSDAEANLSRIMDERGIG